MANRKRNIQMKFWVTEEEKRLIEEKMAQLHTKRSGVYLRKMAIDGYIIQVDTTDIKDKFNRLWQKRQTKPAFNAPMQMPHSISPGLRPWSSPSPSRKENAIVLLEPPPYRVPQPFRPGQPAARVGPATGSGRRPCVASTLCWLASME